MSAKDGVASAQRSSRFGLLLSDGDFDLLSIAAPDAAPVETTTVVAAAPAAARAAAARGADEASDDWSFAGAPRKGGDYKAGASKKGGPFVPKAAPPAGGRQGSAGGASAAGSAHHQKKAFVPPVTVDQLCEELTLEILDFPSTWRTSDVRKVLAAYDHKYRLKWQSDTSCWIHFDKPDLLADALASIATEKDGESFSLRPYAPSNVLAASPKAVDAGPMPTAETALEICGFPSTWRSTDLATLLADFAGKYRLKWRNEGACWVIFDSPALMADAKDALASQSVVKIRPYSAEGSSSSSHRKAAPAAAEEAA